MGNEFNKTEADFVYERYKTMGGVSPEEDIPLEELRPLGTITSQGTSDPDIPANDRPLESAFTRHEPVGSVPVDFDGVPDDGSDPALTGDHILAADIGLSSPEPALGPRAERHGVRTAETAPGRDDVLASDALAAASAAGLTGGLDDYATGEEQYTDEADEPPLEDVPDADELFPGSAVDPAAPPVDAMPGTDVLNGSNGEDE